MTGIVLKLNLENAGYEVSSAHNGQEGYQKAREFLPDLILLDIMMPVMDGYTMNCYLKEDPNTRDIPVIVVSAKSQLDSKFSPKHNAGIEGYFVKPFAIKGLMNRIEKIFHEKTSGEVTLMGTSS